MHVGGHVGTAARVAITLIAKCDAEMPVP